MKLLPEGRSRALSASALFAAAVCLVMAVLAARDLFTLLEVFSTPAFYLGLAKATLPMEMPPLAGLMVRHMRLFFLFSLVFWLSGLAAALGVWARREWARKGACWMLYLVAAAALLLLAYPWLAIPKPFMFGGVSLAPDFNAAVRAAAFFARLGSFFVGGGALWAALVLDRGRLKGEFV